MPDELHQISETLNELRRAGCTAEANLLVDQIRRLIKSRDREIERLRALLSKGAKRAPAEPAVSAGKFEANPPRTALERVLTRLSICTTTREPTGATRGEEITEAEFAGMIAGMPHGGDRLLRDLAELLAWAYLDYPDAMEQLTIHLDTWGRQRVLFRYADLKVTGQEHRRVAGALARRHVNREYQRLPDLLAAMGISERRWPQWRDWVDVMASRISQADADLARHLSGQLSTDKMMVDARIEAG